MTAPIITSLLDLDFYKLTMAQAIFHRHPDVPVRFAFTCRTKNVPLANIIDRRALKTELDHAASLRFTTSEIAYLRESRFIPKGLFKEDFLEMLASYQLGLYTLDRAGDTFRIEARGTWLESTLWETIMLAIVNELYYRVVTQRDRIDTARLHAEGDKRLGEKITRLNMEPGVSVIEFGTRRRFSGAWQRHVVERMLAEAPGNLLGTSNVLCAKELDIRPIGTFAHELFMAYSGIFRSEGKEVRASHNAVIRDWWDEYGEPLSIALTDTYGTDFFFRDLTPEQARQWKGLRQDSGDPFTFGEKAIRFYASLGIDPKEKLVVFSDGLDIGKIERLQERFSGRIRVAFGWGTNLTNDLGLKSLSLIVKAVESCGHGTVKLSDNLAKAMGDPKLVEEHKKIFGHTETFFEECKY